jgi:orotate phosphoribosyltransferase
MTAERRERILARTKELGALTYGDFTLSSGEKSTYYFDGRLLSLDPEGASLLGPEFLQVAIDCGAEAIGGLTLGADPIVSGVVLTSYLQGSPVEGFLVRKEAKGHGVGRLIEGPLKPGSKVLIVDDACSTAGSLFQAIAAAEAEGCKVVHVAAIIDRHQGGDEELARRGYVFTAFLEGTEEGVVKVVS